MNAELVVRRRVVYADGSFAELVVWQVPRPVPPSSHAFKCRLVYIVDGERVVGFDNERGKGDHLHHGDRESPYVFRGIRALIDDFVSAVERWRAQHDKA